MNRRIKMKKLKQKNAYLKKLLKYEKAPQWTQPLPSVATLVVAYNHDGFMPVSMIPEVLARNLAKEIRNYMVIEGPETRKDASRCHKSSDSGTERKSEKEILINYEK